MNIIIGQKIENFVTNLPRVDYELYSSEKTYNQGDKVTLGDKNYICTANNVLNKDPSFYDGSLWVSSPTNATALFEAKANVTTKFKQKLVFEFDTANVEKICFFDLKADNVKVEISSVSWGDRVIEDNLRIDILNNFSDYLYAGFSYKSICEYPFALLYAGHVKVTIDPKGLDGHLGYVLIGKEEYLGLSLYGGSIGIKSFTKKERNVWGDMTIKKGNIYGIMNIPVLIEEHEIDAVYDLLKKVDATPCVFSADQSGRKENLRVLGVYRDLEIPILKQCSTYNLRIESII